MISNFDPLAGSDSGDYFTMRVASAISAAFASNGFPLHVASQAAVAIVAAMRGELRALVSHELMAVIQKLGGCAASESLKRVLIGSTESRSETARRIGCSTKALRRQEQQIRSRLGMGVPPCV